MDETPAFRALLIEDQEVDAMLIQRLLVKQSASREFSVHHVTSLEAACEALTNETFDVALLDLKLPDSHGIHSFHRLRAVDACLPIVILTGHEDETLGIQAVETGAQDFVAKGAISGQAIHRILRYAIARQHKMLGYAAEAHTDSLTGLPNRRCLNQQYEELVKASDSVALMILDIDRFKLINDELGHPFGDFAIQHIANILKRWAESHPGLELARFGGEEFLVIFPDRSAEEVAKLADELLARVRQSPVEGKSERRSITASAGIAITLDRQPLETVLPMADTALYRAKQSGRDQVCFAE